MNIEMNLYQDSHIIDIALSTLDKQNFCIPKPGKDKFNPYSLDP